jgi:serine protease Do/serine protease DegQ
MKLIYFLIYGCLMSACLLVADDKAELKILEDTRIITEIENTPRVSYADVLNRATPSVVAVYTSRIVRPYYQRTPSGLEELLRRFGHIVPQQPAPEGEERLERVGVGSGVIVSEDGYIITNNHVIQVQRGKTADEIRVRLNDDTEYVATLVGTDEKTDVAVLKIEPEEALPAVTIADSSKLQVGDVVFAIGNPLDVGLTATQGIVSALGRDSSGILGPGAYENFIQTDAAINLGNSGGALIDAAGRLIGINTAIVSGSGGSIGIGFAIPSNMVSNVARNLVETGEVPRGLLGLVPDNLTAELAEAFNLESTRGALVNQVQPGSPASKGGIRHGDVIIRVDDVEIESAQQLRLIISQMRPGSEVIVTVIRQGDTIELPVVLGSLNGPVLGDNANRDILDGVLLETLNEEIRSKWSIPNNLNGVAISNIAAQSPYRSIMAPGMVIIEVNGQMVTKPADIAGKLKPGANRLYIWREGTSYYIVIYIQP